MKDGAFLLRMGTMRLRFVYNTIETPIISPPSLMVIGDN